MSLLEAIFWAFSISCLAAGILGLLLMRSRPDRGRDDDPSEYGDGE